MPVGTTAKRQVEAIAKTDQVRECVVLAVVKDTSDIGDLDLGDRLRIRDASTEGSRPCSNAPKQRHE
jgi:hypothetical protein